MRWSRCLGVFLGVAMFSATGYAVADATSEPGSEPTTLREHASAARAAKSRALAKRQEQAAELAEAARRPGARRLPEIGIASWYGRAWHGKRTASGERFSAEELTAAHPTLPLHSRALVTNIRNGKSVAVVITDRGPHTKGRVIDLSQSAAKMIGMLNSGTAPVKIEPLPPQQALLER